MRIRNDREARSYLKGIIDQTDVLIAENDSKLKSLEKTKRSIHSDISRSIRSLVDAFFDKKSVPNSPEAVNILNRHLTKSNLIKADAEKALSKLLELNNTRNGLVLNLEAEKKKVHEGIISDEVLKNLEGSVATVSTLNTEIDRRIYLYEKNEIFSTLSKYKKMGFDNVDKYPFIGRCFNLLSKWFRFDENYEIFKAISDINDNVDSTEAKLKEDIKRRKYEFRSNSSIDELENFLKTNDESISYYQDIANRRYNPEDESFDEIFNNFINGKISFGIGSLNSLLQTYNSTSKEINEVSNEIRKIRKNYDAVQKTYRTVSNRSNSYRRTVEVSDLGNTLITLSILDTLSSTLSNVDSMSQSAYRAVQEAAAEEARRSSYSSSSSSSSSSSWGSSSSSSSSFSSSDSFGGGGGFSSSDSF
jgi:uncharacterized membrane protein YgcG